jgi:AcrR family transcriptional regulator
MSGTRAPLAARDRVQQTEDLVRGASGQHRDDGHVDAADLLVGSPDDRGETTSWPQQRPELTGVTCGVHDGGETARCDLVHRSREVSGVVDDVRRSEVTDKVLGTWPSCAKHCRTGHVGELNCERTDAAGSTGHEYDVVAAELQRVHEVPRGNAGEADRRSLLRCDSVGHANDSVGVEDDLLREHADIQVEGGDHTGHGVAHRDAADPIADRVDRSCEVAAEDHGELVGHGVPDVPGRSEGVDAVDRRRAHGDAHLTGLWVCDWDVAHSGRFAAVGDGECPRHGFLLGIGNRAGPATLAHPGIRPRFPIGCLAMSNVSLRSDAARNRGNLVQAAREILGERGLDAPLDDIARRAKLGNATLYRHFPSRCELVAAVFVDTMRDVVAAAERALDEPDPWVGFVGHLRALCRLQAENRAIADLLTATIGGAPELESLRARAYATLVVLIERAKRAGRLRQDFCHEDVVLLLMANAGLLERTAGTAPTAWERHLDYVLDGLRPADADASPSPGETAVVAAMDAAAHRFGFGAPIEEGVVRGSEQDPCPPALSGAGRGEPGSRRRAGLPKR